MKQRLGGAAFERMSMVLLGVPTLIAAALLVRTLVRTLLAVARRRRSA